MNNGLEAPPDYSTCITLALKSNDAQDQMNWLEQALEIDPDRIEDVLRVANGMSSLAERTPGKAYIAHLKKFAEKVDEKKRGNK